MTTSVASLSSLLNLDVPSAPDILQANAMRAVVALDASQMRVLSTWIDEFKTAHTKNATGASCHLKYRVDIKFERGTFDSKVWDAFSAVMENALAKYVPGKANRGRVESVSLWDSVRGCYCDRPDTLQLADTMCVNIDIRA